MEPDVRDAVVDFIRDWAEKSGMAIDQLLEWLGLSVGKFYQWRQRYGKINQHNGGVPAISGCKIGKRRRSWTSRSFIRRKDTGG